MKRIAVVIALGLLSGCSLQAMRNGAKAEPAFAEVLKQPPLADSILRDGDKLSYQVQVTARKGSSVPDIAQVRASCAAPEASLLFLESPGTLAANGQPTRFNVMRDLTPVVIANLKQNTGFIDACAHTPRADWRVISGTGTQRQLLIDRASVKRTGDSVKFWGAVDEPFILTNKLKKVHYAQTRMLLQTDCSRQTYRPLATFGLNQNNVVTFGNIETAPQDAPFSSAEANTQALLKAACAPSLEQLPVATARTKAREILTPAPLSADVVSAINALGMPTPAKSLRHLVEKSESSTTLLHDLFIEPNDDSGQLHIRNVSNYSTSVTTSLRGLFNLTYQSQFEWEGLSRSAASHVQQLSFSGDWKQMPVGATLGFSFKDLNRDTAEDDRVLWRTYTCLVARELSASKINAALSGNATELNCTVIGERYNATSTEMYLQDYGYFFTRQSVVNGDYKTRTTLVKAE
ncbi:hypothetical protein PS687_02131 [Pseudomonas fluorescens]|nr:hypothetical protein PS687_02131 [Pseudomonas fluorescens]